MHISAAHLAQLDLEQCGIPLQWRHRQLDDLGGMTGGRYDCRTCCLLCGQAQFRQPVVRVVYASAIIFQPWLVRAK
jgi:hypothetical protein